MFKLNLLAQGWNTASPLMINIIMNQIPNRHELENQEEI